MAMLEQQTPRTLVSDALSSAAGQPVRYDAVDPSRSGGSDGSGRIGLPDFALPGGRAAEPDAGGGGAAAAAPTIAGTVTYTVVAGDSLWKIAAKKYGKGKADKMVREILSLNPGLTEDLKVDQKFQLPTAQ
ncbi:MAG: LysM peptidoglycan-binding domain-containing protein [Planctomycetes bacterium]|nr:LysM peptidoglycan-binding domain-containing protein [Planctomycetota bacterium]